MTTRARLVALAVAALSLGGCGRDRVDPGAAGGDGSTLIFARGKDSPGLDPAEETDGETSIVVHNVFDTLVRYRPGSAEIEPALATSWEAAEDRRSITFTLRPGVRFHDGEPCDAKAVAENFERQRDPKHRWHFVADYSYWSSLFGFVARVAPTADGRVRFESSEPLPPFFLSLVGMFSASIVSPKALDRGRAYVARYPVGTGPFRFVSWEREEIVLEANRDWWGGAPAIDRLVFRVMPSPQSAAQALEAGSVHGFNHVAARDAARLGKDRRFVVHRIPGMNVCYLSMQNEKAPFTDARVRRAVALAVDRQRLVRDAYDGLATEATGLVPPTIDGHAEGPPPARDLAAARRLLEEAGAVGAKVSLSYPSNPRPYLPNPDGVAASLREDLREAGFDVTVRKEEWSAYLDQVQNGEHQLAVLGWSADVADADNFLYVLLDKEGAKKGAASNISFYRSEAFHEKVARARASADPAERRRLYLEAHALAVADAPLVPLVHTPQMCATSAKVRGFVLDPVTTPRFAAVRLER